MYAVRLSIARCSLVRAGWAALTVCHLGSKGSVPASRRPATHRVGARTSAHAGYTCRRTNGRAHHGLADGGSATGLQCVVSRLAAGLVTRKTAVCLWPPCQIVLLAAQLVASSVHPSHGSPTGCQCATGLVSFVAGLNLRRTYGTHCSPADAWIEVRFLTLHRRLRACRVQIAEPRRARAGEMFRKFKLLY